jgi:hypothetical protein
VTATVTVTARETSESQAESSHISQVHENLNIMAMDTSHGSRLNFHCQGYQNLPPQIMTLRPRSRVRVPDGPGRPPAVWPARARPGRGPNSAPLPGKRNEAILDMRDLDKPA